METKNINVNIDKELYYELRKNALEKKVDFHSYIKTLYQEAVTPKKRGAKNEL